ncbi:unnamed protein product, partial [Didymodactylos carnosus]
TVSDFIRRCEKISILNDIKSEEKTNNNDFKILFPTHHKCSRTKLNKFTTSTTTHKLTTPIIERLISDAYKAATKLIDNLEMVNLLKERKTYELKDISIYVKKHLSKSAKLTTDYTTAASSQLQTQFDDDDDEIESENETDDEDNVDDNPLAINEDEEIQTGDEDGDDDNNVQQQQLTAATVNTLSTTKKMDFKGMRIKDKIDPEQEKCYFRVNIGGQDKYMHKQT